MNGQPIDLRIMPNTNINAPILLDLGEIDIAFGMFPNPALRLWTHILFTEQNFCVMRRGHPLSRKKLTLERYVQAKHLLVSLTGEPTGFID